VSAAFWRALQIADALGKWHKTTVKISSYQKGWETAESPDWSPTVSKMNARITALFLKPNSELVSLHQVALIASYSPLPAGPRQATASFEPNHLSKPLGRRPHSPRLPSAHLQIEEARETKPHSHRVRSDTRSSSAYTTLLMRVLIPGLSIYNIKYPISLDK